MSVLATLSIDAQLTDSHGIITRVHVDPGILEADGYEVIGPLEALVAIEAQERYPASDGWRRFLSPEGVAYVHAECGRVEELAGALATWCQKVGYVHYREAL